jgi:tetratricopeptide (TPR) repeat protein
MTPYQYTLPPGSRKLPVLALLIVTFAVNSAWCTDAAKPSAFDTLTDSGFAHYYSLEYEQAVSDFQKAISANPDDPKAVNHLLEAIIFRELYKYDALDTGLYTQQSFLTSKQITLDPAVKKQIKELTDKALGLSEKRLKSNPQDVQALYARGVTRALHSTYLGLVEHSWFAALRNALGSRSDHEQVLKLQPGFTDAKTVVGVHNYVVASLPTAIRLMAGVGGIRGDKKKGLEMLSEAGKAGGESSVDANVALGLFLRREGRFQDALDVVHTIIKQHPHNFLFALEEANLLKDAGKKSEAVSSYQALLEGCKQGRYPSAHVEMAEFSLAEALRSLGKYPEAIQAYEAAGNASSINSELRQRALVGAGEVSDLLTRRDEAVKRYQAAIALDSSSNEAEIARRHINKPYREH